MLVFPLTCQILATQILLTLSQHYWLKNNNLLLLYFVFPLLLVRFLIVFHMFAIYMGPLINWQYALRQILVIFSVAIFFSHYQSCPITLTRTSRKMLNNKKWLLVSLFYSCLAILLLKLCIFYVKKDIFYLAH